MSPLGLALKRAFDLIVSATLLIALGPAMLVIALAIRRGSPGPALFRQTRVGHNGHLFTIYKFRTMFEAASRPDVAIGAADSDITREGRFLRRTSLDELPQLFNILAGAMSVVGPRPTLPAQVEAYTPTQRRRLAVKPGVTGWAQVNGRNRLSWDQRIDLDLWYIAHASLWLDLRILLRTLRVVAAQDDVYAA